MRLGESWSVRPFVVAVVAAMLMLLAPSPGARAEEGGTSDTASQASASVAFKGSGWGHGIGLSQWGAYAMAMKGSDFRKIVEHYFTGSTVAALGTGSRKASPPIVVNLEQDFRSRTLRVDPISGSGDTVKIVRGDKTWKAPPGSTITIDGGSECSLVIKPPKGKSTTIPSGKCAFDLVWYDWKSPKANPRSAVAIAGCTNSDWNVSPTKARECRYARGMLHLRSGPGGLDLSVQLSLEDYLLGISEMPYYWGKGKGMAALQAQAVAARSYARELMIYRGPAGDNACAAYCHVRDSTWDQRYVGYGHGQDSWTDAVRSTAGLVVSHPKAPHQTVVRAYFSSSSGGRTEAYHEIRGGSSIPYLQSVNDSWAIDGTVGNPHRSWTASPSASTVARLAGLDRLDGVQVTRRTAGGSAHTVAFTGTRGGAVVTVERQGTWVRSAFDLKSTHFSVSYGSSPDGDGTDPTKCVKVKKGEGWSKVVARLGLPASDIAAVRAANPKAVNPAGHLKIGAKVCAPGSSTDDKPKDPPKKCVKVKKGEGWSKVVARLGLPASDLPAVREANPKAVNAAGYLKIGAKVCAPGSSTDDDKTDDKPKDPPKNAKCVKVKKGEGWVAVTMRLGLKWDRYPEVRTANPKAANSAGFLKLGAKVCAPGSSTDDKPTNPPKKDRCLTVESGEGWVAVTIRLGLKWDRYPDVRAANPKAVNTAGHLKPGAKVCPPT